MKSVLISIRPEWCKKIATGEKTIEIRKTRPKCREPFRCFIYESRGDYQYGNANYHQIIKGFGSQKVIGEFVCDRVDKYRAELMNKKDAGCYEDIRYIGFDEEGGDEYSTVVTSNEMEEPDKCYLCEKSCLRFDEIKDYAFNGETGFYEFYGWHISDLKIYGKPRELSEFYKPDLLSLQQLGEEEMLCKYCSDTEYGEHKSMSTPKGYWACEGAFCEKAYKNYLNENQITRPPQSWCYVEA